MGRGMRAREMDVAFRGLVRLGRQSGNGDVWKVDRTGGMGPQRPLGCIQDYLLVTQRQQRLRAGCGLII